MRHLDSLLNQIVRSSWPLFVLAVTGCDLTGQYEKKFQETLQSSGQRAIYDQHLHSAPTEVTNAARENVGVKLRLPKLFDDNSKVMAPKAGSAALPGLSYGLSRQLSGDDPKTAPFFVVSFAATAKSAQKGEAVQAEVSKYAASQSKDAAWSDVELATPLGTKIPMKRLRAELTDGRWDVYLIDGPNQNVLIAWLFPKAHPQSSELDQAVDASMGTVEVTAAPTDDPNAKAPPG